MKWLRLFVLLGVLVACGCPASTPTTTPGEPDDEATDVVDESMEEAAAVDGDGSIEE